MSLDKRIASFGSSLTSSKLNAGDVKIFFLSLYIKCFSPSLLIITSDAIPIWAPYFPGFTLPPAAVEQTCKPQQIAKIFFF
jgi:hypothetical protein